MNSTIQRSIRNVLASFLLLGTGCCFGYRLAPNAKTAFTTRVGAGVFGLVTDSRSMDWRQAYFGNADYAISDSWFLTSQVLWAPDDSKTRSWVKIDEDHGYFGVGLGFEWIAILRFTASVEPQLAWRRFRMKILDQDETVHVFDFSVAGRFGVDYWMADKWYIYGGVQSAYNVQQGRLHPAFLAGIGFFEGTT